MSTLQIARCVACLSLTLGACQRNASQPPIPVAPIVAADRVVARPPVTPQPPSADAVVVAPGVGIGPFSLGMSRAGVRGLGSEIRVVSPRTLEVDGFSVSFDADEPGGMATILRLPIARATGGVRVGDAVLQNSATYAEAISALGPCVAPQANEGATVTACQNGGVKVVQAGPTQELVLEVSR